jgi:hypothetical protein
MLIGMNHALAAAAAPAFNSAFYATVATVIPILFLAIAVQGPALSDLLSMSATRLDANRTATAGAVGKRRSGRAIVSQALDSAAVNVAVWIIVYGTACEIGAIVVLLVQRGPAVIGILIAIGAIFLALAAALGPATQVVRFLIEQDKKDRAASAAPSAGSSGGGHAGS